MSADLRALERENKRLSELAQTDWLTGVYNRGATEEKIGELLARHQAGALLLLDIDGFRRVNDRYGHLAGDSLLQKIAQVLGYMVSRADVVGRVGGDEFVIYMPLQPGGQAQAKARIQEIQRRLQAIQLEDVGQLRVRVTITPAFYQEGDDYRSLFDRADQALLGKKRARREARSAPGAAEQDKKGIAVDMKLISSELAEQDLLPGAFCQDYETFKSIYRFVGRRLRRTRGSAYLVLFTLTDDSGAFPGLAQREEQMDVLRALVQDTLRMGDVFTQYSSCQFLVMLADVGQQEAELVAGRIHGAFFEKLPSQRRNVLLHHCYPLRPAGR